MANEENAEEIVDLSFVPVCSVVQTCNAGNWRGLICVGLDSNAGVVAHTQQVIHNLESLVAGGEVDGSDVRYLGKFGRGVV